VLPTSIRPERAAAVLARMVAVKTPLPVRGPETALIQGSGDDEDQVHVGPVRTSIVSDPPPAATRVAASTE
jgi:hypothetical protein